jgi:hypothetical protein
MSTKNIELQVVLPREMAEAIRATAKAARVKPETVIRVVLALEVAKRAAPPSEQP